MLRDRDAVANLAVKDLKSAKQFYEGTLGFQPAGAQGEELVAYRSGNSTFNVYRSKEAGTNKATALTFDVDDIGAEARELKDKGVFFEEYDMPGLEKQGDLYVAQGMKTAWFKDPDGNILSLFEGDSE